MATTVTAFFHLSSNYLYSKPQFKADEQDGLELEEGDQVSWARVWADQSESEGIHIIKKDDLIRLDERGSFPLRFDICCE